ncbi:MAG: indole-3-glycerol-phosphate synthase [Gammaproteobacteria bacterium]
MSGDFLAQMRAASELRLYKALAERPFGELEARAREMPSAPALSLSHHGFDVIAEIKRRSPAIGALADDDAPADVHRQIAERAVRYARGGACAISVLTEPTRFDGDLAHLSVASAAVESLGVPVMRKDFLVDPYQIFEARAAGAGGVLLITRMLDDNQMGEMLDAAHSVGLFALVEAFDKHDLERSHALVAGRPAPQLVGINTRDLTTLQIDTTRLATHAEDFTGDVVAVAESGVTDVRQAATVVAMGYRVALIGTALMQADDPGALLRAMLTRGRGVGVHSVPGHA